MRERDRRTYTIVWVVVTAVAVGILFVVGSPLFALALTIVSGIGLVAFLRATHPRGQHKPNINIFFEELDTLAEPVETDSPEPADVTGFAATAPAPPYVAPVAPVRAPSPAPAPEAPSAEVINLRQPARREAAVPTLDDAVSASQEAARSVAKGNEPATGAAPEVAEELAAHHVRLLRRVQTKLQDYE